MIRKPELISLFAIVSLIANISSPLATLNAAPPTAGVAVGPQYDTTHVYVSPEDFIPPCCKFCGNVRRHHIEARRVHGYANAEHDYVPVGIDAGRHTIGVWLQNAGPLSFRSRTYRLPGNQHGRGCPRSSGKWC